MLELREAVRRLWWIAVISFVYWAFVWIMAFALLSASSTTFMYLFFGILEPVQFILLATWSGRTLFIPSIVNLFVLLTLIGHAVALIIRIVDIDLPFVLGNMLELVFIFLEIGSVFIYIFYTLNVYRVLSLARASSSESGSSSSSSSYSFRKKD